MITDAAVATKYKEPLIAYDLTTENGLTNNVQEPSAVYLEEGSFELYFIGLGLRFPKEDMNFPL